MKVTGAFELKDPFILICGVKFEFEIPKARFIEDIKKRFLPEAGWTTHENGNRTKNEPTKEQMDEYGKNLSVAIFCKSIIKFEDFKFESVKPEEKGNITIDQAQGVLREMLDYLPDGDFLACMDLAKALIVGHPDLFKDQPFL